MWKESISRNKKDLIWESVYKTGMSDSETWPLIVQRRGKCETFEMMFPRDMWGIRSDRVRNSLIKKGTVLSRVW